MLLRNAPLLLDRIDSDSYVARPELEARLLLAAESAPGVLIVGDPGAGKSTMLNWLGRQLARERPVARVDAAVVEDVDGFFDLVRAEMIAALGQWPEARQQLAAPARLDDSFGEAVRLQSSVRRLRVDPPVAVLVDNLTDREVISSAFGRLRDLVWTTGHRWFVTSDRQIAQRFLRPPADAFFATRVTIPPLDQAELDDFATAAGANSQLRKRLDGVPPLPRDIVRALTTQTAPAATTVRVDVPRTTAAVLEAIRSMDRPVAVDDPQLVKRLGVSPFTIRRHVRTLVAAGALDQSPEQDGRPGRPRLLYSPVTRAI